MTSVGLIAVLFFFGLSIVFSFLIGPLWTRDSRINGQPGTRASAGRL